MGDTTTTDALVSQQDVEHLKAQINEGEFKRLVCELIIREPYLAIALLLRHERVLAMLQKATMDDQQRAVLNKQLTLLTWVPLMLLDRAHRRHLWKYDARLRLQCGVRHR